MFISKFFRANFVSCFLLLSFVTAHTSLAAEKKAEVAYQKGMAAYEAGQYDKAIANFQQAVKLAPGYDEARFQLAVSYRLQEKYDDALLQVGKLKDPNKIMMAPILKGEILVLQKRWSEALVVWQKISSESANIQSMRAENLAVIYAGLKKPKEAADNFTSYLETEMKPGNKELQQLAQYRIEAKQQQEALAYCETTPYFAKIASYRDLCKAHVYKAAGDQSQAKKNLDRALTDKTNLDALELERTWK